MNNALQLRRDFLPGFVWGIAIFLATIVLTVAVKLPATLQKVLYFPGFWIMHSLRVEGHDAIDLLLPLVIDAFIYGMFGVVLKTAVAKKKSATSLS